MNKSDMFAFIPHICLIMEQSADFDSITQAIVALASAISTVGVIVKWIVEYVKNHMNKGGGDDGKNAS